MPNHEGRDLYSYDTTTHELTDLTVDTNPADAATGADVRTVLGATANGSYIYFTATGALASGAISGQPSLYVWHEGRIDLVAATAVAFPTGYAYFSVTPDGRHAAFASLDPLTGYDNIDPVTGVRHGEVFEYTLGSGIVCVSCRVDGTRPTAESLLNTPSGLGPGAHVRMMSDDGSRVFFESSDAVIPQASNGHRQVFEYENGKISALSPLDGSFDATFLDASASGDDVFINTFDALVPDPNNGDYAVVDARVDGGFPVASRSECSGVACHGPLSAAPVFGAPATSSSSGAGVLTSSAPGTVVRPRTAAQIRAGKLAKALRACGKKPKKKRASCEKSARKRYGRRK